MPTLATGQPTGPTKPRRREYLMIDYTVEEAKEWLAKYVSPEVLRLGYSDEELIELSTRLCAEAFGVTTRK